MSRTFFQSPEKILSLVKQFVNYLKRRTFALNTFFFFFKKGDFIIAQRREKRDYVFTVGHFPPLQIKEVTDDSEIDFVNGLTVAVITLVK